MERCSSSGIGRCLRALVVLVALLGLAWALAADRRSATAGAAAQESPESIPNNHPERNPGGKAATFSTQGSVSLDGEFFQAQGSNGRSCASCHVPEEAWSITPGTLQHLFDNGIAPTLDAVVRHYETRLGFAFTEEERADLVAFLNAL